MSRISNIFFCWLVQYVPVRMSELLDEFLSSEEVKQVIAEFGVDEAFIRDVIEVADDSGLNSEGDIISIDIDKFLECEGLVKVRAALNFLAPDAEPGGEDEDWGDYSDIVPAIQSRQMPITPVNVGSRGDAVRLICENALKDRIVLSELLQDRALYAKLLQSFEQIVEEESPNAFALLAALFAEADQMSLYTCLVDIFSLTNRFSYRLQWPETMCNMLSRMSRRVLLISDRRAREMMYKEVATVITDHKKLSLIHSYDNDLRCLQRWFACHVTATALKSLLIDQVDMDPVLSKLISS